MFLRLLSLALQAPRALWHQSIFQLPQTASRNSQLTVHLVLLCLSWIQKDTQVTSPATPAEDLPCLSWRSAREVLPIQASQHTPSREEINGFGGFRKPSSLGPKCVCPINSYTTAWQEQKHDQILLMLGDIRIRNLRKARHVLNGLTDSWKRSPLLTTQPAKGLV